MKGNTDAAGADESITNYGSIVTAQAMVPLPAHLHFAVLVFILHIFSSCCRGFSCRRSRAVDV